VTVVKLDDPMEAMGVKDRTRLATAAAAIQQRIGRELGCSPASPSSTRDRPRDATCGRRPGTIEPFTILKGHTTIGSDCRIGPFVHL